MRVRAPHTHLNHFSRGVTVLHCFVDFETRSAVDLTATGVYKYAVHHTTSILCMAWAIDDGPVEIWSRGQPFPAQLREAVLGGCEMHAWNASFERILWNAKAAELDWPEVDFDQWRCTAAKSRHANHPGALGQATDLLSLIHISEPTRPY